MWQDKVLTAVMITALFSVAGLLREDHKPSLRHCAMSTVFSGIVTVVDFTLDLWLTTIVYSIYTLAWAAITMQRFLLNASTTSRAGEDMSAAELCEMCEWSPATTTWGFPVCQPCAEWLILLDDELRSMEDEDPQLERLSQQINKSAERLI